jgi:hypothetical protein
MTAGDRVSNAARANEESLQHLILFGQRRAVGKIAKLTGDEKPRICASSSPVKTLRSSSRSAWQAQR